jgi:hypothetical protein
MTDTEENYRGAVIVCSHVASREYPILLAERSESDDPEDTGWQFVCNAGFEETTETAEVWLLENVLKMEPSLRDYIILPPGTTVIRDNPSSPWQTARTEDMKM